MKRICSILAVGLVMIYSAGASAAVAGEEIPALNNPDVVNAVFATQILTLATCQKNAEIDAGKIIKASTAFLSILELEFGTAPFDPDLKTGHTKPYVLSSEVKNIAHRYLDAPHCDANGILQVTKRP